MTKLLITLLSFSLLISCSKDDTINEMLVGEWKMTKISSTYPNDNYPGDIPMLYIFNSNNTGMMSFRDGGGINVKRRFRYILSSNNKRLTITHSDSQPADYTVQKLSINELIISLRETTLEFQKR